MRDPLRVVVWIAGAWTLLALATMVLRALAYGKTTLFSPAAGRPRAGVVYAFGAGMSPTAKESVREHLPAYLAGVVTHLGVFASLALLAFRLAGGALGGSGLPLRLVQAITLAGACGGFALLLRRALGKRLRALSYPDDYASNLLTTGFSALAFASTLSPAFEAAFLVEAALLLAYIPLGKIRHCFFFFVSRYQLGAHFGRRGTFPPVHGSGEPGHADVAVRREARG